MESRSEQKGRKLGHQTDRIYPISVIAHMQDRIKLRLAGTSYEDVLAEFVELEDAVYSIISFSWLSLPELSLKLVEYASEQGLTLYGRSIDGFSADNLVNYLCLGYYRRYQKYYREPDFREKHLDPVERNFPVRDFQIGVARDPRDLTRWRVRKRLFRRLGDR